MPSFGSLLPTPAATRRGVPLYYSKSEEETRRDVYERYDELVTRQTLLHLCDPLHGTYPLQLLADYVTHWLPPAPQLAVADIGCSVGRLIGDIAMAHPAWDCYGLDFSYQMLRQATDHWKQEVDLIPNITRYGFPSHTITGRAISNLHFALADAAGLPFPDGSLEAVFTTFLIDRVGAPLDAFREWQRVLKPGGTLIVVSPLNFLKASQWRSYYPAMKLLAPLLQGGWQLLDLTDPLTLREPMDVRGNAVEWQTIAFTLQKAPANVAV